MYKHMDKVVIKILQGSAVTQTMLGWLAIYPQLQISYSVHVSKIMKIGWQYCKNYQAYFFGPPCSKHQRAIEYAYEKVAHAWPHSPYKKAAQR